MEYWTKYGGHKSKILGKRKKFDNNIYTFDIETSSFLVLNGVQYPAVEYLNFSVDERKKIEFRSCMYIWQFGINDIVYYGRTWEELKQFFNILDKYIPEEKIVFVHNLAYEFQFMRGEFEFENVVARKSHKVMYADLINNNIEFRCSYMMTNCKLEKLPELFNLPVKKLSGDLDYSKIRHNKTPLSDKELDYCEHDCLVVYYYIKMELETYDNVKSIPKTSTGHVRSELKELVKENYSYKRKVKKAINTNPHIYNLLQQAFMGGYTHANWVYADEVLNDIDSWDFTSSYPYVMVTNKYPSTEFKKCNIDKVELMSRRLAYLVVVKFTNLKCKYFNNFISASKCRNIKGAKYDNGRIISADELEITLTDIDFRFILDSYTCNYEILESYYSVYNYLPIDFIKFILKKYVIKTKYKNVSGKEIIYQKEKSKFNALYGMSVTNTIRDDVIYDNIKGWYEEELSNDKIVEMLENEKKKCFLSFAYGVWVTAYARNNLLRNVIKLDNYTVYCDTDSIKLLPGYDKNIILGYNEIVNKKISFVSKQLGIPVDNFEPEDVKGLKRPLGVFDDDGHYEEFITQGAKKYAVKEDGKIKITVAGVPKCGAKALNSLNDFRDDFVFSYKDTNKNLLMYIDYQDKYNLTDYLGNMQEVKDKTGCCLVPTTYVLGKATEYADLISDNSSKRAIYKEGD